ncbi:pyrophosphatase [Methylomonas sp. MV1]|uniref:pyrophosphatase n=1 Tax=Methylomonas sp. MV1 TaxID=3073620 RepID=UPI0028A52DD2|nr:pyrophosphatase [Methylomonas sp. MV1]MDT4329136.1 pyrophosphatase [Methylomonas sp. MV1]
MITNFLFTLVGYDLKAKTSDRFRDDQMSIHQLKYGFFGEVGGLLAAVKKAHRDSFPKKEKELAMEELGDALWYLTALIRRSSYTVNEIGIATLQYLQQELSNSEHIKPDEDVTFNEIDGLLAFLNKQLPESKDTLLYKLAYNTSLLFFESDSAANECARGNELYSKLLSLLAMVAAKFGLKLLDIAIANNIKTESRWAPPNSKYLDLFDENLLPYEQLPRQFEIKFLERNIHGKKIVVQQLNGVNIGDPLTDNRQDGDGYRFHDVFHLAYIAHLGWSPVIRALLKVKRKSKPQVDENQDGARAIFIEEGIATWVFNHARDLDFFEGVEQGKLEYGLLKQIQNMVSGYEVEKCPLWQWEIAILEGFKVFRSLLATGSGIVSVNMEQHCISFKPLES